MNDGRKTPHSGCMATAGLPNGAESTVSEPNMGNKKGQSLGFSRTAVQINSGSRQCLQAGTKKTLRLAYLLPLHGKNVGSGGIL